MPLFSIIIPTYNRSDLLRQCINSVIAQRHTDYELIIVDDGSTDNTEHLILGIKDSRIKYLKQNHQERSNARNHGIQHAKGKYVCFVDDDDLLEENYLLDFYNYMLSGDKNDIILRTGYVEMKKGIKKYKPLYQKAIHKNPVQFAAYNMCGVWSLAIPRKYLTEDQFPSAFPHWQDTHLILRLLAKFPFKQINNHNYIYRIHDSRGSVKNKGADHFLSRAEINVAAMEDLFTNKKELLSPFLPEQTLSFLKAEKYIQYAVNAKKLGYTIIAKTLYHESKKSKWDLRLWKYYILYLVS